VNEMASTLGSDAGCSQMAWSEAVTMLTTPAGISVSSER
jgi:hypothetical protein